MSKKIPKSWTNDVCTGRAIAIKQPYIEEILKGIKKFEYRSRPTKITGRVFLYASKGKIKDQERWKNVGVEMGSLPTGVIVGSVEIVSCEFDEKLQFYKYKLKNPKRYKNHLEPENQAQPCFFFPFGRFEE